MVQRPACRSVWRKSSHTDTTTSVEIAGGPEILIRDSKNPQGGALAVGRSAFRALLGELKDDG